jgi:hypothetical protein
MKTQILVMKDMKILHLIIMAALLALSSDAIAQNPLDAATGAIQDKINAAGGELQQKAAQHILEGNLTSEHIAEDLNSTKENLTLQAKEEIGKKLDGNLNITSQELEQKAKEELKNQLSQKLPQQPGFSGILSALGIIGATILIRKKIKR